MPGITLPEEPINPRDQHRLDQAELAEHGVTEPELEERQTGVVDDDFDAAEPVEQEPARKLTKAEQDEQAREDMARRRRELLNRQEVDEEEEDGVQSGEVQTDDALEPGEAQEITEQQSVAPQDVTPGFYVDAKGQHRYRTVVDGQAVDVSADEAFQRLAAENARLRQAPTQQPQPTNSQQPPADDAVNVKLAELRKERKDAYARMYNGDETAIDDLDRLDGQIHDLTIQQVQNIDVVGKLTEYQTQQRRQAFHGRMANDEQTLLADPNLKAVTGNPVAYNLATQEAVRIMRETNAIDNGVAPIDVMRQAVTNVLKIMAPPGQSTTVDARQQRKQQIGNTAVSAGAAAQVKQRLAQPEPTPDGGATPQQQRRAALAELRKVKGEKD